MKFFDLKSTKLWFETKTFVNGIDFSVRVYGKEGGKPDLVVEANDLAKLKEKILVGIGTRCGLCYIRPATYRRHKIPLLLLEKWQQSSIWQFWITFYVCDKFFYWSDKGFVKFCRDKTNSVSLQKFWLYLPVYQLPFYWGRHISYAF